MHHNRIIRNKRTKRTCVSFLLVDYTLSHRHSTILNSANPPRLAFPHHKPARMSHGRTAKPSSPRKVPWALGHRLDARRGAFPHPGWHLYRRQIIALCRQSRLDGAAVRDAKCQVEHHRLGRDSRRLCRRGHRHKPGCQRHVPI